MSKMIDRKGKGNIFRLKLSCIAIVASVACVEQAVAQVAVLEEIIVTAQKREQSLKDVAIAVTAFSGEQMEALGFESSTELIAFTPGVSMAGDIGGQRAIFNIRGVVQNDYADLAEAPVAVYIDGGYLASTQAQTFGLFDIERVEILKGPQGTLFGRNATGGLVNTITVKPTEELDGYFAVTGARFSQARLEGAISGPFSKNIRARLSFLWNTQDEILRNDYSGVDAQGVSGSVNGGDDGYNDSTAAIRGQLEFDLSERGSVLLSANWADTTKSEGPYQVLNTTEIKDSNGNVVDVIFAADDPLGCVTLLTDRTCQMGDTRPVQGGDFFGNLGDPDGSGDRVNKDFAFDDQNKIESYGISATLEYTFGGVEFVAISDYKNFSRVVGLDSDQTPTPALIFQSDGDIKQFSQEIRLSGSGARFQWVAGLYYLGIDTDYSQGLAGSPSSTFGFLVGEENNTLIKLETDSYSAFGQFDFNITPELVFVAGVRIIQEDKRLIGAFHQNPNLDDRVIEITGEAMNGVSIDNNQNLWSAKVQLEYSPNDNSLFYGGINRGVKAGSFNAPLLSGFGSYDPEELLAYEIGGKFTLFDGKANLNIAAFIYDYTDYQSFSWVNNAGLVFNEQAKFTGVELEFFVTPTPALDIILGASYLDAVVEDLEVAAGTFADTTPPYTPKWQGSGLIRYNWRAWQNSNIAVQLSGAYQSATFTNARNFTAHRIEDHFQIDGRITWTSEEEGWSVIVFLDNLNDSEHELIGFDVTGFYGTSQISYATPRTFGVTLRRKF